MLTTSDLQYRYPDGGPTFHFPDLHVSAERPALLLGPSGSGKSTWLHLLGGVLTPTAGQTVLNDTNYAELSGGQLDRFRGKHIGLIFQRAYFVAALNVAENLALARQLAGLPKDPARIQRTLDSLSIGHHAKARPHQLSVGEQQRVTIARALVNQPQLILADEPTSALDDANASRVSALLRERAGELGAALVVVTHDGRLRGEFGEVVELGGVAGG